MIEAVLTLAIIGAGVLGVLYMFAGSSKSALYADQVVVASNLAREKMDQVISERITDGYAATIAKNFNDGPIFGIYNRTVTFKEIDPDITGTSDDFDTLSGGSGYARVTVTVTWGARSVRLVSLIANYAIP